SIVLCVTRLSSLSLHDALPISGIVAATGGIALVYIASIVLSFFGINLSLIHGSGLMGIGFSLIVVGVAAFNLVLDFDMIEKGAQDRKSTRLNSSHVSISYAVFC